MAAAVAHAMSKRDKYASLNRTLAALLAGERDWIANLANTAALIYGELEDINWVGFYLFKDGELVLGHSKGNRRACASRSEKACVEPPRNAERASWCPRCTSSTDISRAIVRRTRNWWCHC